MSDRRCGFTAKSADDCAASFTPWKVRRCTFAAMAPCSLPTKPAPSPTSTAQPLAAHSRTRHLPPIPRPSAHTRALLPCRTKYPQRPASSRRIPSTPCPTIAPAGMPRKRRRSTSFAPRAACVPCPPPRYQKGRRSSTTYGGSLVKREPRQRKAARACPLLHRGQLRLTQGQQRAHVAGHPAARNPDPHRSSGHPWLHPPHGGFPTRLPAVRRAPQAHLRAHPPGGG